MIDKNELLFVVDEENNPLKPLPRHIVHKKVLWHRATGIWVINKKKQILCQKRSMKKDIKPGMWEAFFGGHLHPKDDYFTNAVAELSEELGITVEKENLIPYKILKSDKPTHREFQHCFIYKLDRQNNDFPIEEEEIDEVKWFNFNQIKNFLLIKNSLQWVHKPWDEEVLNFIENIDF